MIVIQPFFIFLITLFIPLSAVAALDQSDQGSYVLLNSYGEPTVMQMRFFLSGRNGKQWMMDGREEGQDWQPVCRADDHCRLQISNPNDIRRWRHSLPTEWHKQTLHCINNVALAFCRTHHPHQSNYTVYWFFALPDNRVYPMPLQRRLILSDSLHKSLHKPSFLQEEQK